MEVIICALALIILALWYKFNKTTKAFRSEQNSYLEKMKKQQEDLAISQQQYTSAKTQNYEYEKEIQILTKQLYDAHKELEFYKNIEEDSGKLNVVSNDAEYNQLIEQAAQHIRTAMTTAPQSPRYEDPDSCNDMGLLDEEQLLAYNNMESSCANFFVRCS